MDRKGTASFGSIVASIGAILIGVGVAWLLAQNWHSIPAAVKILILLTVTGGSFFAGIKLQEKEYPTIAKSLYLLGALLYTLSVFLIAQIYSTDASLQGTAWLLLISLIGVILAAYLFESPSVLFIGLLELLVWIIIQFSAFEEFRNRFSFGTLSLWFLAAGILFYGLSLLHRAWQHVFGKTYTAFTGLYLLLFAFILSFQLVIPELWKEATAGGSEVIFLIVICVLGIGAVITGIAARLRNQKSSKNPDDKKEIIGFFAIIALLLTIILLSLIPISSATVDQNGQSSTAGYCGQKYCGTYSTRDACTNVSAALHCEWRNNNCETIYCGSYQTRDTCLDNQQFGCVWSTTQVNMTTQECDKSGCKSYVTQQEEYSSCSDARSTLGATKNTQVVPAVPTSIPICTQHKNQQECTQDTLCTWQEYSGYEGDWGRSMSIFSTQWFIWVWANAVLLLIILAVIGYGTWRHMPHLINLGMLFFGLMIISRYIGFIMDFGNYTGMSFAFIIGGILLIGGGYMLEKWRRKLVTEANDTTQTPKTPLIKQKSVNTITRGKK